MVYTEILRSGHWESFLEHLWQQTDCSVWSGKASAKEWRNSVVGREETSLNNLFDTYEELLLQELDAYFKQLAQRNTKGFCLRCNKYFESNTPGDCQLCGWDFAATQRELVSSAGGEFNELFNARYLQQQLEYLKATHYQVYLNKEIEWFTKEFERLELEIQRLKDEIEVYKARKERKEHLTHTSEILFKHLEQLESVLRNVESLFGLYQNKKTDQEITLTFKGHELRTIARPPLKFPINLIMGLQRVTDDRPNKAIRNSCCFIFIYENHWVSQGNFEWKVDLSKILKGKISGEFYVNCFSYLHKNDYFVNINYEIKKLTFL